MSFETKERVVKLKKYGNMKGVGHYEMKGKENTVVYDRVFLEGI